MDATSVPHDAAMDTQADATKPRDAGRGDASDARPVDAGKDARDAADARGKDASGKDASGPDATGLDASERDATDATVHPDAGSQDGALVDATDAVAVPPPTLLSLTVSPLQLTPAFSPSIHDYYVRCSATDAGPNVLQVTAVAATGDQVTITEPQIFGPAAELAQSVGLLEDQALVVNAVHGAATAEYWVRCLPHDFPVLLMQQHPDAGTPPPGYYFVGNTYKAGGTPGHGEGGYGIVVDMNGTPVWYAKTFNNSGGKDTDLVDSNTIAFVPLAGYSFGPYLGSFALHTLNPVGVSYVTTYGQPVDTHELRVMPNGDLLMFADHILVGVDFTGLNSDGGTATFTNDEDAIDCVLQQVTRDGTLVWQWIGSQHMDMVKETVQVENQGAPWIPGISGGPPPNDAGTVRVRDPFHCNAIDYDPAGGGILISARNTDGLFYIQHDFANPNAPGDGKILWKLGGKSYSKDGARLVTVTGDQYGGFHRQHHIRYQPNGSLTVFDDHSYTAGPARGVQFTVDVDAGTASIFWEYDFDLGNNSAGMGSFQVLPDGSRVIGWGYPPGGTTLAFTEVDINGNDLLDFSFPNSGESSYRALKYPPTAIDLESMRKAVGPANSQLGQPFDAGIPTTPAPDAGP